MIWKSFYLFLAAAPLWMPGLHRAASAQVSTNIALPITPTTAPAATPTNIQPATSATNVVQQANEITITGGQTSSDANPNLIHQFQQFDLDTPDTANFVVDPNVANVINLIDSVEPSTINGVLTITSDNANIGSNANLFLVNPAGIIFGEDVTLKLPSDLTATTASALLFDDTYLLSIDGTVSEIALPGDKKPSGRTSAVLPTIDNLQDAPTGYFLLASSTSGAESNALTATSPTGSIENQGNLEVAAQSTINFIGQYIQNEGNLTAPGGSVNLVAHPGNSLLRLRQPGSVLSLDVIPADTIDVISSTSGLPSTALAQLLTGEKEANATQIVANADGSQTLTGAASLGPTSGSILIRGTVDVSTNKPSVAPGQVNVLGNQINMIGGDIYANGVEQGGLVAIGGMPMVDDFRAAFVIVGRNSEIAANASAGVGGLIHVWADDTVQFFGSATANGETANDNGSTTIEAGQVVDIRQ